MAIFIKGKSSCNLCGLPIHSLGISIQFPSLNLPQSLHQFRDACVHRNCVETHLLKSDFLQAWSQYWNEQAFVYDREAYTGNGTVLYVVQGRLIFVSLRHFFVFEEQQESIGKLRDFFVSTKQGQRSELVLDWNNYTLAWDSEGVDLLVKTNPRENSVFSQSEELVNYKFSLQDWNSFVQSWHSVSR